MSFAPLVKLGQKTLRARQKMGILGKQGDPIAAASLGGAKARQRLRLEGLGALDAGLFGAPIVGGLGVGVYAAGHEFFTDDQFEKELERGSDAQRAGRAMTSIAMNREKLKQENLMRLSQADPQVIQELAAGRRLPRGAQVIGGSPDMELLDRMGELMVSGEASERPDPLMSLL